MKYRKPKDYEYKFIDKIKYYLVLPKYKCQDFTLVNTTVYIVLKKEKISIYYHVTYLYCVKF